MPKRFDPQTGQRDYYRKASGNLKLGVRSIAASAGINASDCVIFATGGASGITATLPPAGVAGNANAGVVLYLIKVDAGAGAVTVARAGADTIEGATSISLAARYDSVLLVCDGSTTWYRMD